MLYLFLFLLLFFNQVFALNEKPVEDPSGGYKQAIERQRRIIEETKLNEKGEALKKLALLYLYEQNQELAFEVFLDALANAELIKPDTVVESQEETDKYAQALAIYLDHQLSAQESSKKIVSTYAPVLQKQKNDLLSYLVAISYANLNLYHEFFDHFYSAYLSHPTHFLAYKTKAILHIKLLERRRTESERQKERCEVIAHFEKAIACEPSDLTLYKLLITFSSPEIKAKQVVQCLNKIIAGNMMVPRSDIIFYVQEAVDADERVLAQKFIDKAQIWYPQSRLVATAQEYVYK